MVEGLEPLPLKSIGALSFTATYLRVPDLGILWSIFAPSSFMEISWWTVECLERDLNILLYPFTDGDALSRSVLSA